MPALFVPHGGGPWPFVETGMGRPEEMASLAGYLASLPSSLPAPPRAIVCATAHWECSLPTVSTAAQPPLLFDYYGFPPESYQLTWPAPGEPDVARRIVELLAEAGMRADEDPVRGFDHGTFVPLKVAWPRAEVPVVQLSMVRGLDPTLHLALGRALAPLRDEGILVVGSGMTYHNMRGFGGPGGPDSDRFDLWLRDTMALPAEPRQARLRDWIKAPSARAVHPREEHLLPLLVAAGAGGDDQAHLDWGGPFFGVRLSAWRFGEASAS